MVRKGTKEDVRAVCTLEKTVFSDPWREDDVLRHVTEGHLVLYVYEENGDIVGYLLGAVIPPEGELYRVAVAPDARGRGMGEALCRAFLADSEVCFLEVRKSNAAARRLYEKLGFLLTGERRGYYRDPKEDACLYRREETYEDHRL
ncbi:MAG: ribosomal protein S18-alanine N-acetyltransferase [Clostridia bacterium]|nr:ribosomal protein S18-alanine N-acetyltransferase [Clostridia bacterium]